MKKENILVIGGAGYIGSVCVKKLIEEGYLVSVYDNLSKGRRDLVDINAKFFEGDILDENRLNEVFSLLKINTVIHFAALKDAGESMKSPEKYSKNIIGTINILNAMSKYNIKKIIFSSSAAVYGNPLQKIIDENHPTIPINFYGFSKFESENLLKWYKKLKGIDYISLRYFNVAGDGGLNYIDPDAKNIFPIIGEVAVGIRDSLKIFGTDYETSDGTCIRDYIHVIDLVYAHIKALNVEGSHIINLGTSKGFSVLDLLNAFNLAVGRNLPYEITDKREGDPAYLVADYKKAKDILNWKPKYSLNDMVESTYEVYKKY